MKARQRTALFRIIVGLMIIVSAALSYLSPWGLLFTLFIGLNMLQSGFTRWCLLEEILKKL